MNYVYSIYMSLCTLGISIRISFIYDKEYLIPGYFHSVTTYDYVMYYGSRVVILISAFILIRSIIKLRQISADEKREKNLKIKREDDIQKRTTHVEKHYFKALVISKDKTTDTYGYSDDIRTSVYYTTSVRIVTPSFEQKVIHFNGTNIYNSCMEGEEVAIALNTSFDEEGNILKQEPEFVGHYSEIQKIKEDHVRNNFNVKTDLSLIEIGKVQIGNNIFY